MDDQLQTTPLKRKAKAPVVSPTLNKRAKFDSPLLVAQRRAGGSKPKASSSKLPSKPVAQVQEEQEDSSDSLPASLIQDQDRRRTIGGGTQVKTKRKIRRISSPTSRLRKPSSTSRLKKPSPTPKKPQGECLLKQYGCGLIFIVSSDGKCPQTK